VDEIATGNDVVRRRPVTTQTWTEAAVQAIVAPAVGASASPDDRREAAVAELRSIEPLRRS